jgi:hypothetical protein
MADFYVSIAVATKCLREPRLRALVLSETSVARRLDTGR